MQAAKAQLQIEGGATIKCLFNPKDISVSKSNTWKAEAKQGATAAKPSFGGGTPREMNLSLLFDSTLLKPEMSVKDVTQALFDATDASVGEGAGTGAKKNTKRPPTITFTYGWFSFVAVTKSLTVQYTMFMPDGEPVRADVKLGLMQYDVGPVKGQNPTTRADAGFGAHTVRDGDSLPSIAQAVYGDPTRWRLIAEANGIDDPLNIARARSLMIPRLDA